MRRVPRPSEALRAADDPAAAWLARIVSAKEALEDGATDYAWMLLHELELELARLLDQRRAA